MSEDLIREFVEASAEARFLLGSAAREFVFELYEKANAYITLKREIDNLSLNRSSPEYAKCVNQQEDIQHWLRAKAYARADEVFRPYLEPPGNDGPVTA